MTIEDLSFSGIVDLVQHDKKVGKEFLVSIAKEKEEVVEDIVIAEKKLEQLKTRLSILKKGSLLVLQHLELRTPLAVKADDFIVVVGDENISIERNVL